MEHIGYRKFLKKVQQRVVPEIGELLPNCCACGSVSYGNGELEKTLYWRSMGDGTGQKRSHIAIGTIQVFADTDVGNRLYR